MQSTMAYAWVKDKWTYLGVRFPVNFATFSKVNLEAIDKSVYLLLQSWSEKSFSWFERIQVVKALVLPKYLFIFRVAL